MGDRYTEWHRMYRIGAGVYRPSAGNSSLVEPCGAGITNFITRAELAAIIAAFTYNRTQNALAGYHACHGNSLPAETIICTADPYGNPFFC